MRLNLAVRCIWNRKSELKVRPAEAFPLTAFTCCEIWMVGRLRNKSVYNYLKPMHKKPNACKARLFPHAHMHSNIGDDFLLVVV